MLSSIFRCCRKTSKVKPPVHVLIPLYNAEQSICGPLQSILQQDYPNVKIFIFDDGSTDNSVIKIELELLKLQGSHKGIKIQKRNVHCGIDQTRRELFEWSQKDNAHAFNIWLDADDKFKYPDFISKVIAQMLATQAQGTLEPKLGTQKVKCA